MRHGVRLWIGIGLSAVFLALFFITVDLAGMVEALSEANYVFVVPAVGLYLVSILFRSMRWRVLLGHIRLVSVRRLYPVVVVGYMANDLLPMRMGEVVRAYLVGEREGISKASSLVTIFIERILDALVLLMFIATIALFVPLASVARGFEERSSVPWPLLVVAVSLPFIGMFGLLLGVARLPERSKSVSAYLLRPLPSRLAIRGLSLVDLFLDGLRPLGSAGTILKLFVLSAPIWLFEASLFYLIGLSFGLQDVFDSQVEMVAALVLVTAIGNLGSSIPAAPGGIGLFELVARETLVLLPLAVVDRATAGAYVAVVHAALLLPMIVLGQVILWAQHLSLGGLSRAGRPAERDLQGQTTAIPRGVPVEPEDGG